jgi:prefoldin subunit 5
MDNAADRLERELADLKRRSMGLIAEAEAIAQKIADLDALAKHIRQEKIDAQPSRQESSRTGSVALD